MILKLFNGAQYLYIDELIQIIEAVYREYLVEESYYESITAFEHAQKFIGSILEKIRSELSIAKGREVFLLSRAERKQKIRKLKERGKTFYEQSALWVDY